MHAYDFMRALLLITNIEQEEKKLNKSLEKSLEDEKSSAVLTIQQLKIKNILFEEL